MIYLDYAASTPLHPALHAKLGAVYAWVGNPQSDQMTALHDIEKEAKSKIAGYFKGDPNRLFFTSGATESISTAILGGCRFYRQSGRHIITFETEHKAVLSACEALSQEGFEITVLPVRPDGQIDYDRLKQHIREDTILVSVNGLCNETGYIQDIQPLIELKARYGFMIHLDACQMVGKLPWTISEYPVDFISLSSHKCYGPSGIGALYIQKGRHIEPIIQGTHPVRSGTLPLSLIALMGDAYAYAEQDFDKNLNLVKQYRDLFLSGLSGVQYTVLSQGAPHILNIHFKGITEEQIKQIRDKIYCQLSSACSEGVSHVLQARMGYEEAKSCIRFSFGWMCKEAEIQEASKIIKSALLAV